LAEPRTINAMINTRNHIVNNSSIYKCYFLLHISKINQQICQKTSAFLILKSLDFKRCRAAEDRIRNSRSPRPLSAYPQRERPVEEEVKNGRSLFSNLPGDSLLV